MDSSHREAITRAQRIVVKAGSNVVSARGRVNTRLLTHLAEDIVSLVGQGKQVVVISSGAVSTGLGRLHLEAPQDLPVRQAAAAIGQAEMMAAYHRIFKRLGQPIAQLLITQAEISERGRYLHLSNTLSTLLEKLQVVPILNENDPVQVGGGIGENDRLAALIAARIDADLLVLLSDVDGLYTANPHTDPEARLISTVTQISAEMLRAATDTTSQVGRGGARAKLNAARLAMNSGVYMVITNGRQRHALGGVIAGEQVGTVFVPRPAKLRARQRWIGYALPPQGQLVVDDGAVEALVRRNASLLPAGILAVQGEFRPGDAVSILSLSGREVARGLVNYSSGDVKRIRGRHTGEIEALLGHRDYDEVLHRDNLVLLT